MSKKETKLARQAALKARQDRERRIRIGAIVAGVVVVVGAIVGLVVARSRSSTGLPTAAPDVVATEMRVPDEGAVHVPVGQKVNYSHYPPSSGAHWGEPGGPVAWGFYSEPVDPEGWLHNLEHGGIVVLYNCPDGCPDTVTALRELAAEAPNSRFGSKKIVVAPDGQIGAKIVALAWTRELDLSDFDHRRLLEFYKRWVDQGPEAVP